MNGRTLRAALRAIQTLPISQGAKDEAQARLLEAHLPDRQGYDHQGGVVHGPALRETADAVQKASLALRGRLVNALNQYSGYSDQDWIEAMLTQLEQDDAGS